MAAPSLTADLIAKIAMSALGAYGRDSTYRVALRPPPSSAGSLPALWTAVVESCYSSHGDWHDVRPDLYPAIGQGESIDAALANLFERVAAREAHIRSVMDRPYYGG